MSGDDYLSGSIAKTLAAYRARQISPVEIVAATLRRCEETRHLNAFIALLADTAMAAAKEAEHRYAHPELAAPGPLCGIPVSIKDIYDIEGQVNTAGTRLFNDRVAHADATAVARLRAAGAIVIGRTNLHEAAFGVTTQNPHYGAVHNPWKHGYVPGGSSGGSAASVAVGSSFASLGTDTGGSVRIPAAVCGIVGLKPSFGRVSRAGVTPLAWTLDHPGPLARTVGDAWLIASIIAGPDPADDATLTLPPLPEAVARPRHNLRIGRPRQHFFERLDPEVRAAVDRALRQLEEAGATVIEIDLPHAADAMPVHACLIAAEAAAFHKADILQRPEVYGADVRARLQAGLLYTATEYLDALRVRRVVRDEVTRAFGQVDVLVSPTTAVPAYPAGTERMVVEGVEEDARLALNRLTSPWNVIGLPAISLPCGMTANGLPIGLQFAGPYGREDVVMEAALRWEAMWSWPQAGV